MFSRFDESTHTFISTHLVNPDGTGEVELKVPGPEGGGRWSRDGKHIAVMTVLADKQVATAIIAPSGAVERVLPLPDKSINLVCAIWSPDDSRLACEGWDDAHPERGGIYTVRSADGGDLQRLTTPPAGLSDYPGDYSPDGMHFVYKRATDESAAPLTIINVVDKTSRQLSADSYEDAGRYSPDGQSIATSTGDSGRNGLAILNLDGKVVHRVVVERAQMFGPTWSPDGKWIAFSMGHGRPVADIYVSHPDGSQRRQVTSTPANEIVVEWGRGAQ